jgi:ketosteroid isomerase-like protein
MKRLAAGFLGLLLLATSRLTAASPADEQAMKETMAALGKGFADGDVDAVMKYHHPDVMKALNYNKVVRGREAVRTEMAGTFANFRVEFVEHDIESLVIEGDTAIEITRFAVRGTPKSGNGEPWIFRGRAMVVYVRYAGSPTGWASLRETIQPATD